MFNFSKEDEDKKKLYFHQGHFDMTTKFIHSHWHYEEKYELKF